MSTDRNTISDPADRSDAVDTRKEDLSWQDHSAVAAATAVAVPALSEVLIAAEAVHSEGSMQVEAAPQEE